RLIVDRVPRMGHFARSTPELIVQRLAATTRGAEGELFAELAQALASGSRGAPAPGLPPEPSLATPSQAAGMAEGAIHTQAAARRRPRATV
ncbi:MAG TPA: hypothetical protein VFH47_06555, partial [Candidatus Thermoplasmatota archaeon]|nr:hypothetical protein [Candidatus Thermoplasmatota archaeon]